MTEASMAGTRTKIWLIGPPALYLIAFGFLAVFRTRLPVLAPVTGKLYGALMVHGLPAMVFMFGFANLYQRIVGELIREDVFLYGAGLLTLVTLSLVGWAASRRKTLKKQVLFFFAADLAVIVVSLVATVAFGIGASIFR